MSTRKIEFVPEEFYHIYNRGNSKQKIYLDSHDYKRFLKLLYLCNSTLSFKLHLQKRDVYSIERENQLVNIGAYCLMPNHFHLLITPCTELGMSKFMQKLTTGYSMYFNNKYERTGTLFEGKFKAEHVSDDRYLKYLYAYIHLNPLKLLNKDWKEVGVKNIENAKDFIKSYQYSSFGEYADVPRRESVIISKEKFPKQFATATDFEQNSFEWIDEYSPTKIGL